MGSYRKLLSPPLQFPSKNLNFSIHKSDKTSILKLRYRHTNYRES